MSIPALETLERWSFGNTPAMADDLGALVLSGRKTATASLLKSYKVAGEPLPQSGDFSILENGQGYALFAVKTIAVKIQPFHLVDAAFAYDEGEGDCSSGELRSNRSLWRFRRTT